MSTARSEAAICSQGSASESFCRGVFFEIDAEASQDDVVLARRQVARARQGLASLQGERRDVRGGLTPQGFPEKLPEADNGDPVLPQRVDGVLLDVV
jgi:hypothetical protein